MHSWFPWKSSVPYALVLLAVSAGVNVLQAQKIKSIRDAGKPPSSIDRVAGSQRARLRSALASGPVSPTYTLCPFRRRNA